MKSFLPPRTTKSTMAVMFALAASSLWHPLGYAANDSQQGGGSNPSELELSFWRSTEQVGTAEAYQAYLAKFPTGFFAQLATAAISKAQAARPGLTAPHGPPASPASVEPSHIARPADSGAVSFAIGDTFQGPGVVTVGWLGSKKQLVLPPGRWIVLSANDFYSTHARPVQLSAVVLGRFNGLALASTIEAVFNSRPGAAMQASWNDMTRCETPDPEAGYQTRTSLANVSACIKLRTIKPNAPASWTGVWVGVRSALERLNVGFNPDLALGYQFVQQDNRGNFMKIVRMDYGWRPSDNVAATAPSAGSSVPADRVHWAQSYASLVAKGIGKNLPYDDIPAGGAGSASGIVLAN